MSQIQTRLNAQQDELTIEVSGPFNFDDISRFRAAYEEQDTLPARVVIDLRHVVSIDSAVLGMFLNMQRKLGLPRTAIRIINAPVDVRRILEITHFDQKFTIE